MTLLTRQQIDEQLKTLDGWTLAGDAIKKQFTFKGFPEAGAFTERRYTPLDVLELQVLADLRRRGFSIPRLRRLLSTLREAFGVRLYEAIGEGGPLTLFIGGDQLFARTVEGHFYNLDRPQQALMMVGEE